MVLLFQVATILSNYCSSWATKKQHIILFKILSALFNALSIVSVGNLIESIPVFFTIIRSIVCFLKDKFKSNFPIYLICAGYIIIGICSFPFYTSLIDILPVAVSLFGSIIIWFGTPVGIKAGLGVGDSLWMIYHFSNGLYLSALNILCQILVSLISIIRIKITEGKE